MAVVHFNNLPQLGVTTWSFTFSVNFVVPTEQDGQALARQPSMALAVVPNFEAGASQF